MSTVAQTIFGTAYDVITSGLGGIAIVSFWQRWIVPGSAYSDMRAERDEWKNLYMTERAAHQATRDALVASSQRSDAGVEAAKTVVSLVTALRSDVKSLPPGSSGD